MLKKRSLIQLTPLCLVSIKTLSSIDVGDNDDPRFKCELTYTDGSSGLVMVQDVAWRSVVLDCCQRTDEVSEQEAERNAQRLLNMLSSFLMPNESSRSATSMQNAERTVNGQETLPLLIEAFDICIRQLRLKLPLSRQWHEIYHPQVGSRYDSSFMEDEDGVLENPDAKILLTLSPAIIEYDKDTELGKAHCNAFSAKARFVQAMSADQRAEGRLVCPAIVVLA